MTKHSSNRAFSFGVVGIGAGLVMALAPLPAMAWTKAYVVDWMEPAFYYGGPDNAGSDALGTDCPKGIQGPMDWPKLLSVPYRTSEEIKKVVDPEHRVKGGDFYGHLGYRGPGGVNIYLNPTSIPDPGILEVSGKIAEGFNLDDKPTGFSSPTGEQGIDNVFYKVSGCLNFWRSPPRKGFVQQVANEQMRDGETTVLIILSGNKDPANDDDVTVGIYRSSDKLVKDANGKIAYDYSFKVERDASAQVVFKAAVVNGVLESKGAPNLRIDISWRYAKGRQPTVLQQGKLRLATHPDGSMSGLIGGYQDIVRTYVEAGRSLDDFAINENLGRFSMSGWYYALNRHADGVPDPKTGRNTAISAAYRISLAPAIAVDPQKRAVVKSADLGEPTTSAPAELQARR